MALDAPNPESAQETESATGARSTFEKTLGSVIGVGREILASTIRGQADVHQPYGGVVPELASREHARTSAISSASSIASESATEGAHVYESQKFKKFHTFWK